MRKVGFDIESPDIQSVNSDLDVWSTTRTVDSQNLADSDHPFYATYTQNGIEYTSYLKKSKHFYIEKEEEKVEDDDLITIPEYKKQFFETWTVHGPSHFMLEGIWWVRLLWFCIWVVIFVACVNQCWAVTDEYLENKRSTSLETEDLNEMGFPGVTVCSLNPLASTKYFKDHDPKLDFLKYLYYYETKTYEVEEDCANLTYPFFSLYTVNFPQLPGMEIIEEVDYDLDNETKRYEYKHHVQSFRETLVENPYEPAIVKNEIDRIAKELPAFSVRMDNEDTSQKAFILIYESIEEAYHRKYINTEIAKDLIDHTKSNVADFGGSYMLDERFYPYAMSQVSQPVDPVRLDELNDLGFLEKFKARDKTRKPKTLKEIETIKHRIRCSKTFKRLLWEYLQIAGYDDSELRVAMDYGPCLIKNYTHDSVYNDICGKPVMTDGMGHYNIFLHECEPYFNITLENIDWICTDCCVYDQWQIEDGSYIRALNKTFTCMSRNKFTEDRKDKDLKLRVSMIEKFYKYHTGMRLNNLLTSQKKYIDLLKIDRQDFIASCSFNGEPCTYRDFHAWLSDNNGYCYTFNFIQTTTEIGKIGSRRTYTTGPNSGLRIALNVYSDRLLKVVNPQIGGKVMVHEPDVMPFPEDEGIDVKPGRITNIKIALINRIREKKPVGDCDEIPWPKDRKYYPQTCRKVCYEKQVRLNCGCHRGLQPVYDDILQHDPEHKRLLGTRECSTFDFNDRHCIQNTDFGFKIKTYSCYCPLRCFDNEYKTEITTAGVNLKFYKIFQSYRNVRGGDDVCSGITNLTARVHAFIDKLEYEKITERPVYTLETWWANMGGNLGLFLGLSVVSVMELVEFLVNVFIMWWNKEELDEKRRIRDAEKEKFIYVVKAPEDYWESSSDEENKQNDDLNEQIFNIINSKDALKEHLKDRSISRTEYSEKLEDF